MHTMLGQQLQVTVLPNYWFYCSEHPFSGEDKVAEKSSRKEKSCVLFALVALIEARGYLARDSTV